MTRAGKEDAIAGGVPTITAPTSITAGRRSRVTVRRLMVLIAVVAACLAWMRPALAPVVVLPLLIATFAPGGAAWRPFEIGATGGWLIGAVAAFSELQPDFRDVASFFLSGLMIGLSWFFRLCATLGRERPSAGWSSLAVAPVVGLIGMALLATDRDFELRLRLSEPSLRASARTVVPGSRDRFLARPRRLGLLWVDGLGEHGGAVFWYLPGGFLNTAGLVYIPGGGPPKPWGQGETFRHLRGPWWEFVISPF